MDDFYIVVEAVRLEGLLTTDMPRIVAMLDEMGLRIHPKKQFEVSMKAGVDFLGAKVYCDHIVPGERIRESLADVVYKIATRGEGKIEGIVSYDGLLAHYKSEKMIRRIYRGVGWEYRNVADRRVII